MKYSLRKSFSYRRKKEIPDDDHINARLDSNGGSNSNLTLVKPNQSKKILGRRRRYSSSPPPPSSPVKTKSKASGHPYNNHINDEDDDDDDPFASSPDDNKRLRPLDKLTYQIRKSFRNTLTRQRPRIESTNSNKRLILNATDENRPVIPVDSSISTGLTSPIVYSIETTVSNDKDKIKAPPKRRKAPLAPTHMNHSMSLPNQDCLTLNLGESQESACILPSTDPQQNLLTKKSKNNRSFRARISLLLKKRHAKQQQQQQLQNCPEEDPDHQHHDDQDELNDKKLTFGQKFDTLRRSFHFGKHNSTSKGNRYLLANE